MKESPAVSLQNVSKKFRLFSSPKERFWEALHPFNKQYHREFWALKDITFDVPKGTTLGIVGRNGSGKSTLLQIICSVLRPTLGSVMTSGRVSALLELGAGFNPEFTGRDNVLLNGALVGFTRAEMQQRLPLIKEFADIGDFFDQPVKIYSSGMFVRLAFAAAINVDPDILIVDEALAVGDAKFQYKCYQKFLEFQRAGKTIIFVTHDTNAVLKHSYFAILLENGSICKSGNPDYVTSCYHELIFTGSISPRITSTSETFPGVTEQRANTITKTRDPTPLENFLKHIPVADNCIYRNSYNKNEYRFGDKRAEIVDYLIVSGDQYDPVAIRSGDWVDIYSKIRFNQAVPYPVYSFGIKTLDGIIIYATNTWFARIPIRPVRSSEIVVFRFSLKLSLVSGDYFIGLDCSEVVGEEKINIDRRSAICHINVQERNTFAGIVEMETHFEEIARVCAEEG